MDELDEKVLDITQRQKRAQIMRRYKAKIERSREIAQKRLAPEKNIKKRAYAQARQIVRKRFAGKRGAEYEKLGPSEKMAIDRAIEKKAGLIKKIALRLIPKVKSAEAKRLQSFHKGQQLQNHGAEEGHKPVNEQLNALFTEKFDGTSSNQLPDENKPDAKTKGDKQEKVKKKAKTGDIIIYNKFGEEVIVSRPVFEGLMKKVEKSGIDIETLGEVYSRGRDAWQDNGKLTQEQYAFARVNSYINEGSAYYELDADLHGEELVEKRGLWDNIHAKRKRIKAGSGERMRKPGSKGAPTAQNFRDAQESVQVDENAWNQLGQKKPAGNTLPTPAKGSVPKHGRKFSEGDHVVPHTGPYAGQVHRVTSSRSGSVNIVRPNTPKYDSITVRAKHEHLSPATPEQTAKYKAAREAEHKRMFGEKVEIDEMDKSKGSRRSFDNFKGQDKTAKAITVKNASNDALDKLNKSFKKEEVKLDEGTIHSVHVRTYDSKGEKTLNSKDFANHVKAHGGELHYGSDKGVAFKFKHAHQAENFHRGIMSKFRDLGSENDGVMHEDVQVDEMKGKDPCWKGYQMVGKKKKNGKEVPNCVPEETVLESDCGCDSTGAGATDNAEIAPGTKKRRKEGTVVSRPDTKPSKMGKQKELKDKVLDEEGNSESNPAKREVGTDSLVKAFKKDTPGQDPVLNESFNIAYSAGVGVTLTAADLGMKVKSGFELHPSVVEELKKLDTEEEAE